MTLRDIRFIGNFASGKGGAASLIIHSGDSRPVLDRILFRKSTALDSGGGLAFWVESEGGSGTLTLTRSTFENNFAVGPSALYTQGGTVLLANVSASDPGIDDDDAIALVNAHSGDLALFNVTFLGKSVQLGFDGGTVRVRNSILWAPSSAANGAQVQDSVVLGGCPANATCSNVSANDPLLGPLQDNGGGIPTMLPRSGSPAIDAGDGSVCADPATTNGVDQRGVSRPQGAHCDIGAVEARQALLNVVVSGGGSVSAAAPLAQYGGISNCNSAGGSACSATYAGEPAVVTLTASVPAGQAVTWGGACRGYGSTVTVALTDTPTVCTAKFAVPTIWTVQTADEAASLTSNDCSLIAPGPGGVCSTLRDALNRSLSGDIIRFAPSLDGTVITLTRFGNEMGCPADGPMQCAGSGTLTTQFGPSAFFISGKTVTVDAVTGLSQGVELARDPAQPPFRLFDVDATGGLNLYGLTLRNGLARGGSANSGGGGALGAGGAIFSQGGLTIDRCTFADNTALGGDSHVDDASHGAAGAGVGQDALLVLDGGGPNGGKFDDGTTGGAGFGASRNGGFGGGGSLGIFPTGTNVGGAGGFGGGGGNGADGGIGGDGGDGGFGGGAGSGSGSWGPSGAPGFGGGMVTMYSGGGGSGAGMGGAIFNDAGVLRVSNSTFTNNTAIGGSNYPGTASQTYFPWSASGYGGAVFNYAGTAEFSFATLHGNRVAASLTTPPATPASLAATEAGAIYSLSDSPAACAAGGNPCDSGDAELILNNSIATGSVQLNGRNGDVSAASDIVVDAIHGGVPASRGAGNIVMANTGFAGTSISVDPQVGTLIPGGGLLGVMAPGADSPALDAAANCGGANGIDQRGLARPQGAQCDAGAVERYVAPDPGIIFANGFDGEVVAPTIHVQCSGATSDEDVLIEDFAGTAQNANWIWNVNGGTVTVNDGVTLSSSGATFPFVTSATPIIPASGDFSVRWRARYQGVSNRGTGSLVLSNGLPANNANEDSALRSAHAWADTVGGYGVVARTDANAYGTVTMVDNPPQYLAHEVEYCWVGGQEEVWVDGTRRLRHSNAGLARPTSLWFGNPANAGGNGAWSGFTLDHVYVRRVNP